MMMKQIMKDKIGMNRPNLDNDIFQISLSYMLIYLEQQEIDLLQTVFDFNSIKFCIFNDVHHFSTIVKI